MAKIDATIGSCGKYQVLVGTLHRKLSFPQTVFVSISPDMTLGLSENNSDDSNWPSGYSRDRRAIARQWPSPLITSSKGFDTRTQIFTEQSSHIVPSIRYHTKSTQRKLPFAVQNHPYPHGQNTENIVWARSTISFQHPRDPDDWRVLHVHRTKGTSDRHLYQILAENSLSGMWNHCRESIR